MSDKPTPENNQPARRTRLLRRFDRVVIAAVMALVSLSAFVRFVDRQVGEEVTKDVMAAIGLLVTFLFSSWFWHFALARIWSDGSPTTHG